MSFCGFDNFQFLLKWCVHFIKIDQAVHLGFMNFSVHVLYCIFNKFFLKRVSRTLRKGKVFALLDQGNKVQDEMRPVLEWTWHVCHSQDTNHPRHVNVCWALPGGQYGRCCELGTLKSFTAYFFLESSNTQLPSLPSSWVWECEVVECASGKAS